MQFEKFFRSDAYKVGDTLLYIYNEPTRELSSCYTYIAVVFFFQHLIYIA